MKLKISTPSNVVYEGDVDTVSLPTENGNVTIGSGHVPMVTSIKPGIITIQPHQYLTHETYVSTSKGMAFVDGKIVRIVSAEATLNPSEDTETLQQIKKDLEYKIDILKNRGSVEEIESTIIKLEKVTADIELKKKVYNG